MTSPYKSLFQRRRDVFGGNYGIRQMGRREYQSISAGQLMIPILVGMGILVFVILASIRRPYTRMRR